MFPPSPSIDRGNNAERWIDTVTKLREQIRLHGRTPGLPPSPTGAAGSDDEWFKVPTVNMFQNETGRGGADSWSSQEWLAAFDVLVSLESITHRYQLPQCTVQGDSVNLSSRTSWS